MGDKQNQPFQLSFNASLKIDFQGSRVTSDGGLIVVRELDERLGFGELIENNLTDSRRGKNTARQSRNQTTAPATHTGAAIVPGKLTIAGLPIDDCCVWKSGTLESAIVNEQIVNWPATLKAVNTRNLRGPQRNGALVVHSFRWRICFGSPSTAGWPATKT